MNDNMNKLNENEYHEKQCQKYRYGKEEMLLLYNRNVKKPDFLPEFKNLYVDRVQPPCTLTPDVSLMDSDNDYQVFGEDNVNNLKKFGYYKRKPHENNVSRPQQMNWNSPTWVPRQQSPSYQRPLQRSTSAELPPNQVRPLFQSYSSNTNRQSEYCTSPQYNNLQNWRERNNSPTNQDSKHTPNSNQFGRTLFQTPSWKSNEHFNSEYFYPRSRLNYYQKNGENTNILSYSNTPKMLETNHLPEWIDENLPNHIGEFDANGCFYDPYANNNEPEHFQLPK